MVLGAQSSQADNVDVVTWVDVASIAIGTLALLVSLVFGLRNRGTAKRALALSERQEARRESRIDVYVNDTTTWPHAPGRMVGVNVMLANPTDGPTSLVRAELHLTYDLGATLTTVKIPLNEAMQSGALAPVVGLELPVRLDANAAESGWLVFVLPEGVTGGRPIERYDLLTRDVHSKEASVQLGFFRINANDQAAQDDR